jgi:hypothetical protein
MGMKATSAVRFTDLYKIAVNTIGLSTVVGAWQHRHVSKDRK